MRLSGSVAIVTGGGSGIGRSTAIILAKRGVKIAVCGRHHELLEETTNLIKSFGGKAISVETDIRSQLEVIALVNSVTSEFGSINILVNNAGVAVAKPLLELEESDWNLTIDTNLKGIFFTCKAVIPELIKAGQGVIVNVSSILGKTGIANFSAYSASKFGVIGLTQAIAKEYDPKQICIYALCPGRTSTNMQKQLGGAFVAELSMPPEKVAQKIVGLISGEIKAKSGEDITIDQQSLKLRRYDMVNDLRQKNYKFRDFASRLKRYLTSNKT
ncbi:NAD(P)-dependent oxidoreductase [filamentous cyanobacterium CCT1]|nr:NAD(P)-dependent oxidoreductase [filamentous cyanobacterium CCT1]PSN80768.1 NAD(P)-dependent oxidoreductase [filamentous cyanobacterium CCP4]